MPTAPCIDSFRHKGLRNKLIDTIRRRGINDKSVLQAMTEVPRHFFFDSSFLEFAYEDKAFPIGSGQTISQPYTVAYQTELLSVQPGMKTLEIGTGSGYQACILHKMGAKVYSIERQKILYDKAKVFLPSIGYRFRLFFGDGYIGLPAYAPFDRILITAAAPFIPQPLIDQLNPGGILVAPIGEDDVQVMTRLVKFSESKTRIEHHGIFRFVPMLGNKAKDV